MPKPLVDSGRLIRVAEFVAPWPAFVVCASNAALGRGAELATALRGALALAAELAVSRDAPAEIAKRYKLEADDAREWLRATRWASRPGVGVEHVAPAVAQLAALALIGADVSPAALLAPLD